MCELHAAPPNACHTQYLTRAFGLFAEKWRVDPINVRMVVWWSPACPAAPPGSSSGSLRGASPASLCL